MRRTCQDSSIFSLFKGVAELRMSWNSGNRPNQGYSDIGNDISTGQPAN